MAAIALALGMVAIPLITTAHADDHYHVELRVTALTGVLGPGSIPIVDVAPSSDAVGQPPSDLEVRAVVHNRDSDAVDQLRLVVEVHRASTNRSSLHRVLDHRPSTSALRIVDTPVRDGGAIEAGDVAGVQVKIPADTIPWQPEGGVHPVRIALVRGTQVLTDVTTAVVWLPDTPLTPLRTTMVWPIDAAPTRQLGGIYDAASDRELVPGGRIDRLLTAIERAPQPGVVIAPAAHVLDELRDRAGGFIRMDYLDPSSRRETPIQPEDSPARLANDTLQRIRAIARLSSAPPIAGVYSRTDLDELTAIGASAGLRRMAEVAASEAAIRLEDTLEIATNSEVYLVADPITAAALDLIPSPSLLLAADAVLRTSNERFDTVRPVITATERSLWAVVADPYLSSTALDDDNLGTVLTVQRFVASSAMLYLDDPDRSDRPVLILPPPGWQPSTAVATGLLDALSQATWLNGVDPSSLIADSRRSARPVQLSRARSEPGLPQAFRTDLTAARQHLDIARAMAVDDASLLGGSTVGELEDALIKASSLWLRGGRLAAAEALVAGVHQAADAAIGSFELNVSRVTLTSDTGMIPVAIHRPDGDPAAVAIDVIAPGQLAWPEGRRSAPILLNGGDHYTVSFATQALSTGTFPVTVRILDPTGRYELDRATLPVRSTAISRPALIVIGVLVVALIGFGSWRQGTDRRPRSPVPVGGDDDRR